MREPFDNGINGDRDARGRFMPGNPGGPGRPANVKVAELRAALLSELSAADVAAVVRSMTDKAKGGDVQAARLVLAYAVGEPRIAEQEELEARLKALESAPWAA